jgi:hypothetical protein
MRVDVSTWSWDNLMSTVCYGQENPEIGVWFLAEAEISLSSMCDWLWDLSTSLSSGS